MSNKETIRFSIYSDEDGFVSLQCPFCKEKFKLTTQDIENEHILSIFCPHCGLTKGSNSFLTREQKEQALRLIQNTVNEMLNDFTKNLEKSFSGNKHVTFKNSGKLKSQKTKVIIEPYNMDEYTVPCCQKHIKAFSMDNNIYCPFCGGYVYGTSINE
ncbi:TFIIB-type zinc ribbon-containing protein [Bacillus cereus]